MADVTISDVDATYVNPPTVEYDAGELRRADQAMFVTGGIARTSPTSLAVSVDGSDVVTVKAGSWVIPGNAVAGSGVWRGGIASDVTANLAARDATYGRIDLVVARQLDTDVVGTHGAYTGRLQILTGTPSAAPVVPALPSMAVELGRITVPAQGGGAASVDLSHRTYATAVGGVIVAPSSARLPAGVPTRQRARALDTGMEYEYDGASWDAVGSRFGVLNGTTDANGQVVVNHGGGAVPSAVSLSGRNASWEPVLVSLTATQLTIRMQRRSTEATAPNGTGVSFDWVCHYG